MSRLRCRGRCGRACHDERPRPGLVQPVDRSFDGVAHPAPASCLTTPRSPVVLPSRPSSGCAQVARFCRSSWRCPRRQRHPFFLRHSPRAAEPFECQQEREPQALLQRTSGGTASAGKHRSPRIDATAMDTGPDRATSSARSGPRGRRSASDVRRPLGRGASAHWVASCDGRWQAQLQRRTSSRPPPCGSGMSCRRRHETCMSSYSGRCANVHSGDSSRGSPAVLAERVLTAHPRLGRTGAGR